MCRHRITSKSEICKKLFRMGKVGMMVEGRLEARDKPPGASSWVAAAFLTPPHLTNALKPLNFQN